MAISSFSMPPPTFGNARFAGMTADHSGYQFYNPDGTVTILPYKGPSLLDQIVQGLAIAGVGAGFGAGALGALAPETAASIGLGSSGAADAGATSALADAVPAGVDVTGGGLGELSGGLPAAVAAQQAAVTAGLPLETVTIPGALASAAPTIPVSVAALPAVGALGTALDAGAGASASAPSGTDTLVDQNGNVISSANAPENVLVQGALASHAADPLAVVPVSTGALGSAIASQLGNYTPTVPATGEPTASDYTDIPDSVPITSSPAGFTATPDTSWLSALTSSIGSSGVTPLGLGLGALNLLGGIANRNATPNYAITPGPSSTAATQGPLFNQPLGAAGNYLNRGFNGGNRDWYHYGEIGNQPQFFTNNQLTFPGWVAAAHGGALSRLPMGRKPLGRVRGGGDGQSDSIPARLSSGEYVLTASDVSRIGQGDSEAGVRKLDQMRSAIARDAGARKYQGKVKHPLQYLKRKRAR